MVIDQSKLAFIETSRMTPCNTFAKKPESDYAAIAIIIIIIIIYYYQTYSCIITALHSFSQKVKRK